MANVIVVGCGRVGSELAGLLSENGDNVCVIDINPESFKNLDRSFNGSTLLGRGFDEDVLIRAGIEETDVFLAVTQLDNTNLMAVEVAQRLFGVPHAIARLSNPKHERAYQQLGVDYVCDTSLVAEEILAKTVSRHGCHIESVGEYEIIRFRINLVNKPKHSIRVGDLERPHQVRVVAFERADGSANSIPTAESILHHGDTVVACVHMDLLEQFAQFIME